ncbi:HGGxSTG domain-containing protein [Bradyrhizobium sp. USDA 3315]
MAAATAQTQAAAAPRIKFSSHGFCIDHPDPELGARLMANALGVADRDAMDGILRQLVKASVSGGKPCEVNLAFMISMVRSIGPRDSVEAMLVAQMVSVHVMAMRCAHHLAHAKDLAQHDSAARIGPARPHLSRPDRGAEPPPQPRRARHHRAERQGRGWRQRHRRQRHAACARDRVRQQPGIRGAECAERRGLAATAEFRRCRAGRPGMSDHIQTTGPMLASRRCGARTRCGGSCRAPAVRGKTRCRMHGGATGSGAPRANRNARKHGRFTREAIAERRQIRALLGDVRRMLVGMK